MFQSWFNSLFAPCINLGPQPQPIKVDPNAPIMKACMPTIIRKDVIFDQPLEYDENEINEFKQKARDLVNRLNKEPKPVNITFIGPNEHESNWTDEYDWNNKKLNMDWVHNSDWKKNQLNIEKSQKLADDATRTFKQMADENDKKENKDNEMFNQIMDELSKKEHLKGVIENMSEDEKRKVFELTMDIGNKMKDEGRCNIFAINRVYLQSNINQCTDMIDGMKYVIAELDTMIQYCGYLNTTQPALYQMVKEGIKSLSYETYNICVNSKITSDIEKELTFKFIGDFQLHLRDIYNLWKLYSDDKVTYDPVFESQSRMVRSLADEYVAKLEKIKESMK